MDTASLIGIDLGKHCFHLHAQDASGRMVFRKKLTRHQMLILLANLSSCTVVMEACAGAHWVARQVQSLGHEARLISPQFVKPFRQGNKNDFADAQAICEAASRPSMRFVSPHNEAQQVISALHRVREGLVRERTGTINQIHAFLLEFGISLPRGMAVIRRLPVVLATESLPPRLIALLERLHVHFKYLDEQIAQIERELLSQLHEDERSERLLEIPGIGPMTASVLMSELGDARQYGSARQFAASIGLVPRQYSTGGKPTLLGISKRGDKNLRRLLVQCARAIMQGIERRTDLLGVWVQGLLTRRHSNVVACALANKLARIAWAILAKGTRYRSERAVPAA
ncbi:IS110 family transposase [Burkholderia stabilis]|uniref:Transposase n=1 Tax=Burkholderia stabilis TaxID=95485 RepID=A0A1Y1BQB8_9BURK|nr:IS110 family transposase [Burkholderia stabilis]BAX57331.1 transposase [Burkholderia stabilis]BAX58832.1 transposase [Burkholderia stabilis]BAX59205.1 transposase [Burkholderia stabilis]BAX59767.1 transposase [Burkholderia stabilis]